MAIEKNLYDQTDWELLRRQKLALIEVETAHRQANLDTEMLVGLIHFIDAVQDDAEGKGYPVFPSSDDEPTCSQCGGEIGIGGVEDVCADCVDEGPAIEACSDFIASHKTHQLPSALTVNQISNRLGFAPNVEDNPFKVFSSWGFTVDGKQCAIWDYKGARWSAYDPHGVLDRVFPELVRG